MRRAHVTVGALLLGIVSISMGVIVLYLLFFKIASKAVLFLPIVATG